MFIINSVHPEQKWGFNEKYFRLFQYKILRSNQGF